MNQPLLTKSKNYSVQIDGSPQSAQLKICINVQNLGDLLRRQILLDHSELRIFRLKTTPQLRLSRTARKQFCRRRSLSDVGGLIKIDRLSVRGVHFQHHKVLCLMINNRKLVIRIV